MTYLIDVKKGMSEFLRRAGVIDGNESVSVLKSSNGWRRVCMGGMGGIEGSVSGLVCDVGKDVIASVSSGSDSIWSVGFSVAGQEAAKIIRGALGVNLGD